MINKVLFIGCNYDQIPYLKELKNRQFYVVGTDINSEAPGVSLCDQFYNFGYDQYENLVEVGKKEKFTKKDFVFTASAQFAHLGASIFAERFGIKYPPKESIDICLDKSKYYRYFDENKIPIPKTSYIEKKEELISEIDRIGKNKNFFLKSDQSKNPYYIYKFNGNDIPIDKINWNKDRYLRKFYILQEELLGTHLRLNIFGNNYTSYPFDISKGFQIKIDMELLILIIHQLKHIIASLYFTEWLIKFDIIINNEDWVALDVGLDPPYRMLNSYIQQRIDFYKHYINQYIEKKITYTIRT